MAKTGHTILIIDDDQYLRELYQEILTQEGYLVTASVEGHEGLEKISKNNYDLILLDIMMPKLDGISVLKEMQAKNLMAKVKKIVLLTNLAHGPVISEASKLGVKDYLIKADLTPDELVAKIKEFLK
jgi:DNA-binding response OmpR family regulator